MMDTSSAEFNGGLSNGLISIGVVLLMVLKKKHGIIE